MAFRDNRNADDGGADKLRISMTNLILGRDPIVSGNRQGQRKDETAKIHASANGTGGEAEKIVDTSVAASQAEENKDAAAPTGGDAAETASEVASSCSHGASSDECSDCKNKCSECEEAEGNDQEGSASAEDTVSVENSAAAQDENSSVGADADQPSSPASASASANDGDSASEGNTGESPDKVASAYDGSAQPSDKELSVHSSSGAESGGEDQDSSGKGDDASTGISTPGADSSNDGASDQGSHKAASAENTDSNESSGPGPASDSGWSISEDHLLRGMKEAGDVTWAEIGQALNRGKNEVKARWKVIQKAGEKHTADADKPQSSASEPSGENKKPRKLGKADNSQAASSDGNDGDAESVGEATKGSKSKGKGKGKAPAIDHQPKWRRYKGQDQNKSASSKAATSEHEGDGYEESTVRTRRMTKKKTTAATMLLTTPTRRARRSDTFIRRSTASSTPTWSICSLTSTLARRTARSSLLWTASTSDRATSRCRPTSSTLPAVSSRCTSSVTRSSAPRRSPAAAAAASLVPPPTAMTRSRNGSRASKRPACPMLVPLALPTKLVLPRRLTPPTRQLSKELSLVFHYRDSRCVCVLLTATARSSASVSPSCDG